MVILSQREFDRFRVQAEAAYPEECCAILLGNRDGEVRWVSRVVPALNVHEDPDHRYEIAPQALITAQRKAREEGLEILGFAHSHPDAAAAPSATDLEQAYWLGCTYGIASVEDGAFRGLRFYRLDGESLQDRAFTQEGLRIVPTASE